MKNTPRPGADQAPSRSSATGAQKLSLFDYAGIVGCPLAFVAIAVFGIRSLLGPAPEPNPVQILREGKVRVGTPASDAIRMLGRFSEVLEHEDGSRSIRYTRTDWSDVSRDRSANLAQDEAWIDIGPDGNVSAVRFERIPMPSDVAAPSTDGSRPSSP